MPNAHVDAYVERFSDVETLQGCLNWYAANPQNRQLLGPPIGPVTVPAMFIWSDGDKELTRGCAENTAAYVEAPYRFEVIEGVSHWVPEIAAERVNGLLLEHLAAGTASR